MNSCWPLGGWLDCYWVGSLVIAASTRPEQRERRGVSIKMCKMLRAVSGGVSITKCLVPTLICSFSCCCPNFEHFPSVLPTRAGNHLDNDDAGFSQPHVPVPNSLATTSQKKAVNGPWVASKPSKAFSEPKPQGYRDVET